jgi:hypothetical protein
VTKTTQFTIETPVYSEADQIQIIALTKALQQGIAVAYLDASHSSREPTIHRFLASDEEQDVGQELGITLLYRPGRINLNETIRYFYIMMMKMIMFRSLRYLVQARVKMGCL